MHGPEDTRAWGAVGAGLRPSSVIALGAVLTLVAPLLYMWTAASMASWVAWGGALLFCGAGLAMSGMREWFGPVGIVAGVLFIAQAIVMVVALIGVSGAALLHRALALPKMLVLVLIALATAKHLGPHRRMILGLAGAVGAARILARVLETIPPRWDDAVDAGVNTLVALALWLLARGLRRRENEWAHQTYELQSSSFEDFNQR